MAFINTVNCLLKQVFVWDRRCNRTQGGNNRGCSSLSVLITFTMHRTTKVKRIKLKPAFSIASSWVRRQVQQIRGKPSGESLCTGMNVFEFTCVYGNILFFKKGHRGANPVVISLPTCRTVFAMTQAAGGRVDPPGVPTCHARPSIISSCTKWVYPKWLTVHGSPVFYCMWPFIQLELLGHIKSALE